jgi:shikimate kinase
VTGPAVVLCGPMGAGKTSVGRVLARRRRTTFVDSDREVERRAGRTVAQIFAESGEPVFRQMEREAVSDILGRDGVVVALGGGTVMDEQTQGLLSGYVDGGGAVVFLDVAADVARRVGQGQGRPMLGTDPVARWTELMVVRRPVYEQVSTFTVPTDGQTPTSVALTVDRLIGGRQ